MVISEPFEVNTNLNPGSYIHYYKNGLVQIFLGFPVRFHLGRGKELTGGCFHDYNGSNYYPISLYYTILFYQNKVTVEIRTVVAIMAEKRQEVSH